MTIDMRRNYHCALRGLDTNNFWGNMAIAVSAGCLGSHAGGGTCEAGARSSAIIYLYNNCGGKLGCNDKTEVLQPDQTPNQLQNCFNECMERENSPMVCGAGVGAFCAILGGAAAAKGGAKVGVIVGGACYIGVGSLCTYQKQNLCNGRCTNTGDPRDPWRVEDNLYFKRDDE